jgi:hypothetical protein
LTRLPEAYEKYEFLFEFEEGDNFNHPDEKPTGAGKEIGQKEMFCKGLSKQIGEEYL